MEHMDRPEGKHTKKNEQILKIVKKSCFFLKQKTKIKRTGFWQFLSFFSFSLSFVFIHLLQATQVHPILGELLHGQLLSYTFMQISVLHHLGSHMPTCVERALSTLKQCKFLHRRKMSQNHFHSNVQQRYDINMSTV